MRVNKEMTEDRWLEPPGKLSLSFPTSTPNPQPNGVLLPQTTIPQKKTIQTEEGILLRY